jgi:hypothetical protein
MPPKRSADADDDPEPKRYIEVTGTRNQTRLRSVQAMRRRMRELQMQCGCDFVLLVVDGDGQPLETFTTERRYRPLLAELGRTLPLELIDVDAPADDNPAADLAGGT